MTTLTLSLSLIMNFALPLTMMFITLLLGIPVLWFCIQIAFAMLPARAFSETTMPRKNTEASTEQSPRIAVLVPAHNESRHLIPTLRALLGEKNASTRILVVADNCTDDTAAVARNEGAEVIERTNTSLRGKGYALDFGIQHLTTNPPQVLVVIDADCLPEKGAVQTIAHQALTKARPVQALYLMGNPVGDSVANSAASTGSSSLKKKIAEFAWLVKNRVRPRGLHRMGLACQLTGSGMAFPWPVFQEVSLATGSIVEDMKLGMELTEHGHPPLFSEHTLVTSTFPSQEDGVHAQRTRWEHGHLSMLLQVGIPKLFQSVLLRNSALFFLALDLCIPPLALLVMSVCAWMGLSGLFWFLAGNLIPLATSMAYLLSIVVFVILAWLRFGRHVVSGLDLLKAPWYVLGKLPIYASYLFRRQAQWIRAKRDNETK